MKDLYKDRPLSEGYPGLKDLGANYKKSHGWGSSRSVVTQEAIVHLIECLERLINLNVGTKNVLVIGCGPTPVTIKCLIEHGFDTIGVDVLPEYVNAASEFLQDGSRVCSANAASLPFDTNSKRIILMESLLEHVDSPTMCLSEAYRVLEPGGVLYVQTTNRLSYTQGEFRVRFYNWLPTLIKECYVFNHLHYCPNLANYSSLPAVHWFSYSKLCDLGREVGFGTFYSRIDLINIEAPRHKKSFLRRWFLQTGRYSPWMRALALTQAGDNIFMLKRPDPSVNASNRTR